MKVKKKSLIIVGGILIGLVLFFILTSTTLLSRGAFEKNQVFKGSLTTDAIMIDYDPNSELVTVQVEEETSIPEQGTEKYFLSQVEFKENIYAPSITKCLFDEKGNEIYPQWTAIYYPSSRPYQIVLVRIKLTQEVSLDKNCFIKEIKFQEDWQEVKTKYNFSKEKFGI